MLVFSGCGSVFSLFLFGFVFDFYWWDANDPDQFYMKKCSLVSYTMATLVPHSTLIMEFFKLVIDQHVSLLTGLQLPLALGLAISYHRCYWAEGHSLATLLGAIL